MNRRAIQLGVGAFVVVTFVIYSLHQRNEGSRAVSQVGTSHTPSESSSTAPTDNSSASSTPTTTASTGTYKDGTYTGASEDAVYGNIQVKATISGGKLTDVTFLDYPQDRRDSIAINQQAMPLLKQQAIQAQAAQVDGVSGATDTSQAFIQSLSDALSQARA